DQCVTETNTPVGSYNSGIQREKWSRKIDFVLSCIGFAVGLGNIWRFPYLCYKNGGGAFLIPYVVCLVFGGIPIFILEIALGQYMSQGPTGAWAICPLFKGIGVATVVIVFLMNIYYIVVLAWGGYYLTMSFTSVLPWSHCGNEWNTARCVASISTIAEPKYRNSSLVNSTKTLMLTGGIFSNNSNIGVSNTTYNVLSVDSVVEFWEKKVLQLSGGIDNADGIVWELALSLFVVWVVVYFCVWRGIKWTGKVVYFTATFPYVILTILLIRGVTLDGAMDGIKYYLNPDFTKLGDAQVWIDGGTQIFFSYAIALGAMITLGSYNSFNNNFYRDCVIIASVNSGTSLYGGFAVFSVLGFMAKEQGVPISEVAEKGPGLAFVTYPKAVTQMPISSLWAVLFFFMLFLIGLDSQFVGVEAFVTSIKDIFPKYLYKTKWRMLFVAVYCFVSYLFGLSMVTRGGMYVFQLFDYYCASGMVLLWVCFFESVVVGWVFGDDRFHDVMELMLGFRINPLLGFCWKYFTPVLTLGILLFQMATFTPLSYNKTYVYPDWAQGIGMCLAIVSMACIPLVAVIVLVQIEGTIGQVSIISMATKPTPLRSSLIPR
ncbi:hypothetical protein ScPMuIL_001114, partial [Solemya velum]